MSDERETEMEQSANRYKQFERSGTRVMVQLHGNYFTARPDDNGIVMPAFQPDDEAINEVLEQMKAELKEAGEERKPTQQEVAQRLQELQQAGFRLDKPQPPTTVLIGTIAVTRGLVVITYEAGEGRVKVTVSPEDIKHVSWIDSDLVKPPSIEA